MQLPTRRLRKLFGRLLAAIPVRIKGGPNEGRRWSLPVAGRHRAGDFEAERVAGILALVRPGDVVWDIGAHHGYVTLALGRAVGPEGRVRAFEPSAYNFAFLDRHVRWNRAGNVEVENVGVHERAGEVRFGGEGSSQTFAVGAGGEVAQMTTLEALLAGADRPPDVIKMDTEGSEGAALAAGAGHLPKDCAVLVSIHSDADFDASVDALESAGFEIFLSRAAAALAAAPEWGTDDPDILALGPGWDRDVDTVLELGGFTPLGRTSEPGSA